MQRGRPDVDPSLVVLVEVAEELFEKELRGTLRAELGRALRVLGHAHRALKSHVELRVVLILPHELRGRVGPEH
eukprot:2045019-Lingulodinium_polyedra.AAC.1